MAKEKKLLCGLDIGTNSVGWCVTDENNNIIKRKGKSLWGVRMFDEKENDGSVRRSYRQNRIRLNRRQERIDLLQTLFAEEINKVDSHFFMRLKNANLHFDDKEQLFKQTLFNDLNFTDKELYKNPNTKTIYHLRHYLVNSNEKQDIRLIYLAFHHLIKYRGNFLNNSDKFTPLNEDEANENFNLLNNCLGLINDVAHIEYNADIFNKLKEVSLKTSRITKLKESYNEILNPNNNKTLKNIIIPLMVGGEVNINKFGFIDTEEVSFKSLCVSEENFDLNLSELVGRYTENEELLKAVGICKKIYQFFLLGRLLGSHKYLCDAMVERYNTHHKELRELKKYVATHCGEQYGRLFRKPKTKDKKEEVNYSKYIGSYVINNKKETFSHGSQEDFYKLLKEILGLSSKEVKEPYLQEIKAKMETGDYLSLINSSKNGVFPYQLNLMEIEAIIANQSKFYPFLNEKNEDGLSISDKIISILKYKIPYYVGHLAKPIDGYERTKSSWIVRTEEKIYPWNFEKVIDLDNTATNFINRMLNKCTYLPSCYCLPKNSIIFSYYNVLSMLNKILINGTIIKNDDKKNIIKNLFIKKRKVSKRDLLNYFKSMYGTDVSVTTSTGKELEEINCNMASYYDFVNIFGEEFVKNNINLIESIIRDIVIFEDKNILEKRLEKKYNIKDKTKIKKIKGYDYSKYSRISKELLMDLVSIDVNGEIYGSILKIMEESNQNLQEVIFNEKYNFEKLIKEFNKQNSPNYECANIEEYVNELYVSPRMKRPLIQAYKIVDELEKIIGKPIDEYYVECARTNKEEKKKRSNSRYQKLCKIYDEAKSILKGNIDFERAHSKLKELSNDEGKFQSDKYYLYFIQMGKCMYSGESIDLADLADASIYQIDHIIPQTMVKDDSITNRVLVKQEMNQRKADVYPISQSLLFNGDYNKAYAFYKMLKANNFINEDKLARLTRRELSESDLAAFVNRQLVETNQAVKGFIEAIKYFKVKPDFEPKVIYSKAENISDFRRNFDIPKSRTANNFHHAHDAYLNIVVGRTIDCYFKPYQQNAYTLKMMHDDGKTTNVDKIFFNNKNKNKKPILDSSKNIVWNYEESINKTRDQILNHFDIFTTTRTYCKTDLFGKTTIYPAGKGGNIPVKTNGPLSNVSKYGGFKEYSFGYYSLIKINNEYVLEPIPAMFNNPDDYLKSIEQLKGYSLEIAKVKINTVFKKGKTKFCITGKTNDNYLLKNLNERIFSYSEIKIIKKIEKLIEKLSAKKIKVTGNETVEDINKYGFIFDGNRLVVSLSKKESKQIFITNEECMYMQEIIIKILRKDIYNYPPSLAISSKLIECMEKISKLSILGKVYLLNELLSYLKCNERKTINLSIIGQSQNSGVITSSKKLKNCSIIYESITGFYSKVMKVIE